MSADLLPPIPKRKNLDVECLRCGAFNVVENKFCGACGASLPVVYDEDGNVFQQETGLSPGGRTFTPYRISPYKAGWILRAGVLLFALATAFFIILKGHAP